MPSETRRNEHNQAIDRRAALLGTAVLVPAALLPTAGDATAATTEEGSREPRYVETEHMRAFYQSSRF
jgi:hypothetical protein